MEREKHENKIDKLAKSHKKLLRKKDIIEHELKLYKRRDASEKLFCADKPYLGDKALRVYGPESADAKIFVEFVALIIRNKMYTCLKNEMISVMNKA